MFFDVWKALGKHVCEEFPDAWEQLQSPFPVSKDDAREWRAWITGYTKAQHREELERRAQLRQRQLGTDKSQDGSKYGWVQQQKKMRKPQGVRSYPAALSTLLERSAADSLDEEGGGNEACDIWVLAYEERMRLAVAWMRGLRNRCVRVG